MRIHAEKEEMFSISKPASIFRFNLRPIRAVRVVCCLELALIVSVECTLHSSSSFFNRLLSASIAMLWLRFCSVTMPTSFC